MRTHILKSLRLLHLMENLKTELRHSWLSDGRQESVAEHSWRLALMVILFGTYLDKPINVEKALKMAIIHDMVEAEAGDVPVFEVSERQSLKQENEQRAIENIRALLNNEVGNELYAIWQEFEKRETYEAKFVNALDKVEVIIQHNEADMDTWLEWEMHHNLKGAYEHCKFDSMLTLLSETMQDQVEKKLAEAGIHLKAPEPVF